MTRRALLETAAVDLGRLASWMDSTSLDGGPIEHARLLTGGSQNILLAFEKGGTKFVLRRPPSVPRPGNNETMLREARILGALAGTRVPHPGLIAACADESVLGAAFYLMQPVNGFNATSGLPKLHADDPAVRHAMGLAYVDGAAALGGIDYRLIGLEDFGRPGNFLERQVKRWQRQYSNYQNYVGWQDTDGLVGLDEIALYLERERPASFTPGIMHGDYNIANVMFSNDGPQIAAIVDWELATIGDPLLDLGYIVATWRGAGGPDLPTLRVEPWDGFPTIDELVAQYASQSERDLSAINWYVVMSCYRLAILLEGTFARACAGDAPVATGDLLHATSLVLVQRALYRIANPLRLDRTN